MSGSRGLTKVVTFLRPQIERLYHKILRERSFYLWLRQEFGEECQVARETFCEGLMVLLGRVWDGSGDVSRDDRVQV